MPFPQYAPFFEPEELDMLTAAFNCHMARVECSRDGPEHRRQGRAGKEEASQRILVSATAGGVRDVETLKEQALRSLAGGVRLGGEQTSVPEAA